jgi:hypothetical protein
VAIWCDHSVSRGIDRVIRRHLVSLLIEANDAQRGAA